MAAAEGLTSAPLTELAQSLRRRQVSPVELVDAYLRRIAAAGAMRAYITVPAERARRQARRAEQRLSRGEAGALLGVPIAVKDLFATRSLRTTAGSRILRDWVPSHDAAAVARLRAAGAIILGKTNLHEFAYGSPMRTRGGGSPAIHMTRAAARAARVAAPRLPWSPASARAPSARTPGDPSGSRLPCAAASA